MRPWWVWFEGRGAFHAFRRADVRSDGFPMALCGDLVVTKGEAIEDGATFMDGSACLGCSVAVRKARKASAPTETGGT